MSSALTLYVKSFHRKTSPFTLNPQGFSENTFTLDVKTYLLFRKIFFPQLVKQQPERRGNLGGRR